MGAASTCTELVCAGVDDALAPATRPRVVPSRQRSTASSAEASAVLTRNGVYPLPSIDSLWQEFRRQAQIDDRRKEPSFAGVVKAARLAEGLWRLGSVTEAASTFGQAQIRCEELVETQPGPRAELLLAELVLSRALVLKECEHPSAAGHPAIESLELLHRALDLAQRHVLSVAPWAARAALVAAVSVQNLGLSASARGDWGKARALFEEALARVCEARAAGNTPRTPGMLPRLPRHAYLEQVQRNLVLTGTEGIGVKARGAPREPEAPSWWHHGGLAGQLDLHGAADAALAHRLCASALLMGEKADISIDGSETPPDEPAVCADEARVDLWLDIANGFESRGDVTSAQIYRERAYKHACNCGISASSPSRRRAWEQKRKLLELERGRLTSA